MGAAPVCGAPVSSHGLQPEDAETSGHCSPPDRFCLQSPVPLSSLQLSFFSDRCFLSACSFASRLFLWYIFTPAKARQRIKVFAARIYSSRGTCSRTSREKDTCDCSRSHVVSLRQPLSFCKCYWARGVGHTGVLGSNQPPDTTYSHLRGKPRLEEAPGPDWPVAMSVGNCLDY